MRSLLACVIISAVIAYVYHKWLVSNYFEWDSHVPYNNTHFNNESTLPTHSLLIELLNTNTFYLIVKVKVYVLKMFPLKLVYKGSNKIATSNVFVCLPSSYDRAVIKHSLIERTICFTFANDFSYKGHKGEIIFRTHFKRKSTLETT